MAPRSPLKIGLMSRLEFGSIGSREGLWDLAAECFIREGIDFAAIVGGLVDEKELREKIRGVQNGVPRSEKHDIEHQTLDDVARYLADRLPVIPGKKIRLVTSPNRKYDGRLGRLIAERLVELRKDIVLPREGNYREEMRRIDKVVLGFYTPIDNLFRSKHYDNPTQNILINELRNTRGVGDFNIVGCGASSVFNPGDSTDIQKPFASLPSLAKIDKNRSGADNQIGIRILILDPAHPKEPNLKTYSFKDIVSREWCLVGIPEACDSAQKKIVNLLKTRGPLSIGQLVDFSGFKQTTVLQALDGLTKLPSGDGWPGLYFDEDSRHYTFPLEWFQRSLSYPAFISEDAMTIERFAAFSCLHAGCRHTDMEFFCEQLPGIIVENDIAYLVGTGDFIEGYEHNLLASGEAYGSRNFPPNYDWQEALAAYMVAQVVCKVFDARMKSKEVNKDTPESDLIKYLEEAVVTFLYISGNHCEWTVRKQVSALSIFTRDLEKFVRRHIENWLLAKGVSNAKVLKSIIQSKLVRIGKDDGEYNLSSGIKSALMHPEMSRTLTPSIRLQSALRAAPGCHIVFEGNFHTAEALEEWHHETGQRLCLQLPTLKVTSKFERGKMKIVDFGIWVAKVYSAHIEGVQRVQITEVSFRGQKRKTAELQKANKRILDEFEAYILEHDPNCWKI